MVSLTNYEELLLPTQIFFLKSLTFSYLFEIRTLRKRAEWRKSGLATRVGNRLKEEKVRRTKTLCAQVVLKWQAGRVFQVQLARA